MTEDSAADTTVGATWYYNLRESGTITAEQYDVLMRPLRNSRVASRSQGGKQLSYLEAWDVKAHLIRVFGFGNFDSTLDAFHFVQDRVYQNDAGKDMVEVIYSAKVTLVIRDPQGRQIATYSEGAVGSASGPVSMLGDHHDNALKTAESDALKRCAINLGTQFGLSLYDSGNRNDVVRSTVVKPEGWTPPPVATDEQVQMLKDTLGAEEITSEGATA